ncbi:VOC family protein [Myxococcus sp. MxC21-1]|uniref:VOC family protein n=1 Tax=Myxococcus sp. MxC21-1 TaxID=3041439 RepID=UPI00292FD95E|nr:VOC family protein [Myxococcus sp. MxC21-1]WNZ58716.1 VOC family protein [Myxococcus sp. MxC21-1]
MTYKPDGYTSAAPYLVVDGANRTIDFLVEVFGAERLRMFPGDAGRLAHGEVRIGDTVIMLSDAANGWPVVPAHVHVYVADVDRIYQRAIDAGAVAVKAPVNSGDGDKRGGFRDAGGTTWWVSTQEAR